MAKLTWDKLFGLIPPLKDPSNLDGQIDKVLEEAQEYKNAQSCREQIEELGDILHAAIILLRMGGPEQVRAMLEPVIAKNRARGYYEE